MQEKNFYNNNLQSFLLKFKKYSTIGISSFETDPEIYCQEVQIPDLWLKTRKHFDKNLCFVNEKGTDKKKKNIYPDTQFIIPDIISLMGQHNIKVEILDLESMFGKVKLQTVDLFADDTENEKQPTLEVENEKNFKFNEILISLEEKNLHLDRKWYLIIPESKYYGPYSSLEMYEFLDKIFKKFPVFKKNNSILVCDSSTDVYFRLSSAMEILIKEILVEHEKDQIKNNNLTTFYSNNLEKNKSNIILNERKLPDNHFHTKYDSYQKNSQLYTSNTEEYPKYHINNYFNDNFYIDNLENIDNCMIKNYCNNIFDISIKKHHNCNNLNDKYDKFIKMRNKNMFWSSEKTNEDIHANFNKNLTFLNSNQQKTYQIKLSNITNKLFEY